MNEINKNVQISIFGQEYSVKAPADASYIKKIAEYLDSYILLGFDFQGRHLDIKSATTPQQMEALNSFLLKYFASEVQSIKGLNSGPDEIL